MIILTLLETRKIIMDNINKEENLVETIGALVGKIENQLDKKEVKLDELVAKEDKVDTEAKTGHDEHIDDLKSKSQVAQSKLDEFKASGNAWWATFKTGGDVAWKEIMAVFRKLDGRR